MLCFSQPFHKPPCAPTLPDYHFLHHGGAAFSVCVQHIPEGTGKITVLRIGGIESKKAQMYKKIQTFALFFQKKQLFMTLLKKKHHL